MAKHLLKPTVGNTVGLDQPYTKLGTGIKNAVVFVDPYDVKREINVIRFNALIFWNGAAETAWETDQSVVPILVWPLEAPLDMDSALSIRDQCLNYLLTIPQFSNGWQIV